MKGRLNLNEFDNSRTRTHTHTHQNSIKREKTDFYFFENTLKPNIYIYARRFIVVSIMIGLFLPLHITF